MLKRVLMVMLVFCLLAGTVARADVDSYFPDVPDNAPYAEAVNTLADMELVKGDDNGNYNPDNTITRAEFATIMCRMLGVEEEALEIKTSSFTDVPASHWACGYVTMAAQLGIVNGMGDGTFAPGSSITYEQAVKVLVCAIGYEDEALAAGGWPNGYIALGNELGITSNTTNTGSGPITRGTMAILVLNAIIADMSGGMIDDDD